MKKLSTNQIRAMWLDFFQSKNHHFLPPASLIPVNDPSLLWINSGVATLKPYFDGRLVPPAKRLVNSQKAIRTNDIENVGVTARHQTMFEMLGNFSIGDYFKEEAIVFAWELLTSPRWFAIDPKKLYVTVFEEDLETYKIWTEKIGLPHHHIFKMGRKTNFWDVGQGPAGPNSEIFFDRGSEWDPKNLGPKLIQDDIENDRYIEIWNIVFSQFNNDGKGNYTELPRKNIDTGAGLERLASIFQNAPTNFETDLFLPTIHALEDLVSPNIRYRLEKHSGVDLKQDKIDTAFKVIADHLRAIVFAIAEGVVPSNKERGYVVRRLLRRAQVYGFELGLQQGFLHTLVDVSIQPMREFYPELQARRGFIKTTIRDEEEKFLKTLSRGHKFLNQIIAKENHLSAKNIWLLFESFGFPAELTLELARKKNIKADWQGFKELSVQAKTRSRQAQAKHAAWDKKSDFYTQLKVPSQFTGWEETTRNATKVSLMFQSDQALNKLSDEEGFILLDKTPFYAEKGGQAPDKGILIGPSGQARVIDVQEGPIGQSIHHVIVSGKINKGDVVKAVVDPQRRSLTQKNHSATHLLHSALREVLGSSVMQSGSYNDENGLRLDFSFHRTLTPNEISQIQDLVHQQIARNHQTEILFVPLEEAVNRHHALAFFGDKYDQSQVRVVKFGDFSCELCGGTHVDHTTEIEDFLITEVGSKGKGIIRIKAITSHQTIKNFLEHRLEKAQAEVKGLQVKYQTQASSKLGTSSSLEKNINKINQFKINSRNWTELSEILGQIQKDYSEHLQNSHQRELVQKLKAFDNLQPRSQADGTNRIDLITQNLTLNDLKQLADRLRARHENLIAILKSGHPDHGLLVVAISPNLQDKYSALEIFRNLPTYRTQGGGNSNLAQGKYVSTKKSLITKK